MVRIGRLDIVPELMNSSCAWASDFDQLQELYDCPLTGAVTTRTATLDGYDEHADIHTFAFASDSVTSINSFGYSPHPLPQYLEWIGCILRKDRPKPIILSITSPDPAELETMVSSIQSFRSEIGDVKLDGVCRIGVELNTSCPNITNKPPPAYTPESLRPLLDVLARAFLLDPTLTIGLKLPPYTYSTQYTDFLELIATYSRTNNAGQQTNPFAFLASTNTLGSSLLFAAQTSGSRLGDYNSEFALPTPLGGLAGEAIHSLSLGNVFTFSRLLKESDDEALRRIMIIGVGGVTSPAALDRMRQAGADVVACATLLGREGVQAFKLLQSA